MIEDAVRVTEKTSRDFALPAYALRFGETTVWEVCSLLAGLNDLVYDAVADDRRRVCEVVANLAKMTLRCRDENVFGHLAVTSPVLEEGLGHFLRDEFAAFGFSHTLLQLGHDLG